MIETSDPDYFEFYAGLQPELAIEAQEAAERIRGWEVYLKSDNQDEIGDHNNSIYLQLGKLENKLGKELFYQWGMLEGMTRSFPEWFQR